MEFVGLLGDHGQDTCVGVISVGSPNAAAEPAVEALKAAGRPQVFAIPRRVSLLQMVVADRGAEVATQGSYGFGLGMAIATDDSEITA